ncbi:helix-hairpin-helix domain-containing protein, partial [Corallococcus exiguus]
LRMVRGLGESSGRAVETARRGDYTSVGDLARRARIPRHDLTRLALSGALASLCGARRQALWEIQALGPLDADDLFFGMPMDGTAVQLPPMAVQERVVADYDTVGLSLEKHPMELLRPTLKRMGAVTAEGLKRCLSYSSP